MPHTVPAKSGWKKFTSFLIGNRRLKSFLFTQCKFFCITFIQANRIRRQEDETFNLVLKIISYSYMGVLFLLFTERYIREIVMEKWELPMDVYINWTEALVYFTYFLYSCFTVVTHIVFIGLNRANEPTDPLNMSVDIVGVFVNFYVCVDKAVQFLHSNQSKSHYLADGRKIPKLRPIGKESIKEQLLDQQELEKEDQSAVL